MITKLPVVPLSDLRELTPPRDQPASVSITKA